MAGLLAVCTAAAPSRDSATIVDSGSTNTAGYKIVVASDGHGTLTMQSRMGSAQSAPTSFTVATKVTARFFADLKAVREAKVDGTPCMKSASFGTSTRVQWHQWASPDLDCPADNPLVAALVGDVNAIRAASGVNSRPLNRGFPILVTTPAASP